MIFNEQLLLKRPEIRLEGPVRAAFPPLGGYTLTVPEGEYLQYGGQAIIEGVMMRSPRYFSVACRAPNREIVLQTEALEKTWIGRQNWLKKPFLRGSLALLDAMSLGVKAMKFASQVQLDPERQLSSTRVDEGSVDMPASGTALADDSAVHAKSKAPSKAVQDITIGSTIVVSIAMGLAIFQYLPNLLSQNLQRIGWDGMSINFVTEVIKIAFFLGYIWLIGQLKDIQEVFKYHGAEHKAINTMEAGQELTMENCRAQTRLHPRCGTSFAIVVLIVSMVIFTFVPRYPLGENNSIFVNATVRFFLELLILPFIAGIAYELIRFAGKFRNKSFVQALFWPGLMSQYLTTREPEDDQIEVALTALKAVVEAEKGHTDEAPEITADEAAEQIA